MQVVILLVSNLLLWKVPRFEILAENLAMLLGRPTGFDESDEDAGAGILGWKPRDSWPVKELGHTVGLNQVYSVQSYTDTVTVAREFPINEIVTLAQEKADTYKHQQTEIILSDDDIVSKYNAFTVLRKFSLNIPQYSCISTKLPF